MPFAASYMTDEDEKKNQDQNGGVNVSGQSTSFSTGLPGQEGAGSGAKTKGSGDKFANIQSYLDVNQSQGNQMGQKIAGDVSAKAEDATQKVQTFESKAPTVSAYDPNEAYQNVLSLSDQQKKAYQDAKAGYKGPATLDAVDGYQDTQKAVSTAATSVKNAGTEEGQRQLLKDTYKKPSYTAGQNALDQTIVQNSTDSRKGFEDLTQKYSGLSGLFDTAATNVGGKVNDAQKTALANQQAIAAGDVAAKKGLMDPIAARAADQNKNNEARIKAVSDDVTDDVLSAETLAMLGLSEGTNLYDLNLSSYLNPNRTQVGIDNVANADERAKYAALTALIDGQAGMEITKDGKAINPMAFNKDQFNKDSAASKTSYEGNVAKMNENIASAQSEMDFWAKDLEIFDREIERLKQDIRRYGDSGGKREYEVRLLEGMRAKSQSSFDNAAGLRNDYANQLSGLTNKTGNRVVKKG